MSASRPTRSSETAAEPGLRRRYWTGGLRFPARLNSAAHAGWSSDCRLFRQDRIRPPPGAMPLQNFSASALHSSRTLSAFSARAFELSRHAGRSEEHTSELQSRLHLVCRLLLEKK